ncbi:MAG: hypothetical protein PHQ86_05340 [Dehalococcoidales bacterium]|nr:hypothetical protein [Dehalococcoidales bacterium]
MVRNSESDIQLVREDLMGELKAIIDYQRHIEVITNGEIRHVLEHIRDDEKEHVAELIKLIRQLDEMQDTKFKKEEL